MGNYRIAVIPTNFKQVQASDLEIDSGTLSVDATNNRVGVNTTSPGAALGIDGDIQLAPTATSTGHITSTGSLNVRASNNIRIGDDGADSVRLGRINTTAAKVHVRSGADDDLVVSNSKVGIGTDSPSTTLHVDGATTVAGAMVVDGSNISLDSTSTLNIDNSNTSNGITIGTATSGVPVSIGHSTSETTVNDNLTVTGDLTVNGTTTTINSTTLTVDDKVVVIASGAADSSAADGAGISVDGASATILYDHTGTQWEMNKPLEVTGAISSTSTVTATGFIIGSTAVNASAAEINEACDSSGRTAAAVAVADDHFLFCDGGATGATRVESLADYATAIAGTGISASSGVLSVDAAQTQITSVGTIGTGTWQGTAIAQAYIANDAINGDKIADNAIDSEHYTDGSIDTAHIADDQVTLAKMAGLARGSIIVGDSSGNPTALSVGSDNHVLTVDSNGDIGWEAASGGGSVDLNGLSAATVDVANDSIAIIDANDSNNSKKESIADLVSAMAGTGLAASSGQLTVSAANTGTALASGGVRATPDMAGEILATQVFS